MKIKSKNAYYLFLAGAPRSGTSYLFNLLKQHTSISPHKWGESYFFMDNNHPLKNRKCNYFDHNIADYQSHFRSVNSNTKYYLDGTDHLIYQNEMMEVIKQLTNKKMILILREPANRVFSSFQYTKYNLGNFKKEVSFEEYVDAIKKKDQNLINSWFYNKGRSQYILERELIYSNYFNYVNSWINIVGRKNIIIFQFEKFITSVEDSIKLIFNWLGLNEDVEINLSKVYQNASRNIYFPSLHKKVATMSTFLPKSNFKNLLKEFYYSLHKKSNQLISKNDLEVIESLKHYYINSNNKLETLIEYDKRLW